MNCADTFGFNTNGWNVQNFAGRWLSILFICSFDFERRVVLDNDFGGIGAREQMAYPDFSFVFDCGMLLTTQVGLPHSVLGNVWSMILCLHSVSRHYYAPNVYAGFEILSIHDLTFPGPT